MLWLDWQKLKTAPFIHAGVAFLTTQGDKQPSWPFWCSLTRMTGHTLASDNPIKNSVDILISEGCLSRLVYYGYLQLTYWTCSFKVFFDQTSHIHTPYSRPVKRALKIDLVFCYTLRTMPGQHNSLTFPPCHQCTWLLFYELSSLFNSGVHLNCLIGVRLGRVHWNTIRTVGWALCRSLIPGWCQAFCVPILSGLVLLCSWIHSALFCTQAFEFAILTIFNFVLRDTDQTISLHEYAVYCCQPVLFCSMSGTSFLPTRSKVSLLFTFTLNQASTTTSHSIMPCRKNGKLTYLGFVRGCLIGLA